MTDYRTGKILACTLLVFGLLGSWNSFVNDRNQKSAVKDAVMSLTGCIDQITVVCVVGVIERPGLFVRFEAIDG